MDFQSFLRYAPMFYRILHKRQKGQWGNPKCFQPGIDPCRKNRRGVLNKLLKGNKIFYVFQLDFHRNKGFRLLEQKAQML